MNSRIRPTDKEDMRRVKDLERVFQTKDWKRYNTIPSAKQVVRNSPMLITLEDGTKYMAARIDDEIVGVEITLLS